jgi:hypothetical protein
LLGVLSVVISFFAVASVYAMTPTLTLSNAGGDSALISVSGDSNMGVMFYYNVGSTSGMLVTTLGTTNANGQFSTTISAASYGLNSANSVYVVVNGQQSQMQSWPGVTNSGAISLSQSNVTLSVGQNTSLIASGGNGTYSISNNSNSAVVSVALSGNNITVNGTANGSSNITICDQSSRCANLSVTVGGASSSGSLSFNQTNPSVGVGQNISVNVSGGSEYYVSNNSNSGVALASVNGNVVTISGSSAGNTTITICSLYNGCASINVNVGSSGTTTTVTNQSVSFGLTNPTIALNQSVNTSLAGGSGYFVSSNANSNVVQATINGTTLVLFGKSIGTDAITVCSSSGGCNTINVTVTATNTTATSNTTTVTTNSNDSLLSEIKSMQAQLAQVVTMIQTMTTRLNQLASGITGSTSNTSVTTNSSSGYKFLSFLSLGSTGNEVTELQRRLTAEGVYSGPITGYYGPLTESAVKKYQSAHGIDPAGYIGPNTRAVLNGE